MLKPIQRVLARLRQPALVPGWERTAARLSLWAGRPDDCLRWCKREALWWGRLAGVGDEVSPETRVLQAQALRTTGSVEEASALVRSVLTETAGGQSPRARAAAWRTGPYAGR